MSTAAPISYVESVPSEEKPYHIMFDDDSPLARTNISRTWVNTSLYDIRGKENSLSFEKNGIAIQQLPSRMSYADFSHDERVWNVYFPELEGFLKEFLRAREVKFFRYGLRKRHPGFPVSTGEEYDFPQPTAAAHVDATLATTVEEIKRQYGEENAWQLEGRRFQWVNVWKPLRGPMNDWPLCLCDASTVDPKDSFVTDMVYADYFTENISLAFNENQTWYFLSDHRPDEIIIFKQSDSDNSAIGGVPHCSFNNPKKLPGEAPRESIEARALVIY